MGANFNGTKKSTTYYNVEVIPIYNWPKLKPTVFMTKWRL